MCHEYKFFFLKTKKTAGTGIEIAPSKCCGEVDTITTISAADETLRPSLGSRGSPNLHPQVSEDSFRDGLVCCRRLGRKAYYNHMPAAEASLLGGPRIWNKHFKFCVERNPWDRMISLYYWTGRPSQPTPLADFVASRHDRTLRNGGAKIYTQGGRGAGDRVCLCENLRDE